MEENQQITSCILYSNALRVINVGVMSDKKASDHHFTSNTMFHSDSLMLDQNVFWSVLLVEETGVPGENHRPATNY